MPTIYLIRHGETMWNRVSRHQGHNDSPLTLRGIGQIRAVAERLGREPEDWGRVPLYCSPLFRTRQSMAILCDSLRLDYEAVRYDDRLKERSYGRWEGLIDFEIKERFPEDWKDRLNDHWGHVVPEGGESYAMLTDRVGDWLGEQPADTPVLVVCHGGTGRALRGLYLGLPNARTPKLPEPQTVVYRLAGGAVTELETGFPASGDQ